VSEEEKVGGKGEEKVSGTVILYSGVPLTEKVSGKGGKRVGKGVRKGVRYLFPRRIGPGSFVSETGAGTIYPNYGHHSFPRHPLGIRDWGSGPCNHPRR